MRSGIRTTSQLLGSTALFLGVASMALTGCASPVEVAEDVISDVSDDAAEAADSSEQLDNSAIAHITSCDQVAGVVEPYIQNLALRDDSTVDKWGVYCAWEMAEGDTDMSNNRGVEVLLEPEPADKPDLDAVAEYTEELQPIENAWVAANGGVAYSLGVETAVAAVINTTVWLPEVEASVTGGRWGDYPALDGPAAVEVVEQLLG